MPEHSREDNVTLEILETIDAQEFVSQRHLADRLGVALGLVNLYMKRCVHKGLIKMKQAPANRFLYYLTPKGFTEKARLTGQYLTFSFDFYRRASESCQRVFEQCSERGWNHIAFVGISELAEIALLRASERGMNVVCVIDQHSTAVQFHGRPVVDIAGYGAGADAYVITALKPGPGVIDPLLNSVSPDRVLIPDLLGVTTLVAPTRSRDQSATSTTSRRTYGRER